MKDEKFELLTKLYLDLAYKDHKSHEDLCFENYIVNQLCKEIAKGN